MEACFEQQNRQKPRTLPLIESVNSIFKGLRSGNPLWVQTAAMKKASSAAYEPEPLTDQKANQRDEHHNRCDGDDGGQPQTLRKTKTKEQRQHSRKNEHHD